MLHSAGSQVEGIGPKKVVPLRPCTPGSNHRLVEDAEEYTVNTSMITRTGILETSELTRRYAIREDILAVKVEILTPKQRNEIAAILFDDNEHVVSTFFRVHPRKVPEQSSFRDGFNNCVDLTQACDGDVIHVCLQDGKIPVSFQLAIKQSCSKYNVRIRNNEKWEYTEGNCTNTCINFLLGSLSKVDIVVTAQTVEEAMDLHPDSATKDFSFTNIPKMKLHFPKKAVKVPQRVHVSCTPIDEDEVKRNRVKYGNTHIVGITPTVFIRHDEPFTADLSLTLPITLMADVNLSECDIVSFHCENDNVTTEGVVKGSLCQEDNTCVVTRSKFSGAGAVAIERREPSAQVPVEKTIELLIGLLVPCSILIFLGKGITKNDWMMMADIVPESEVNDRIASRVKDEQYCVPLNSRSGSIYLKRNEIISIDLDKRGTLAFGPEMPTKSAKIHFFHNLKENYALFPVIAQRGIRSATRGTVLFSKQGKVFHTAYPCPDVLLKIPFTKTKTSNVNRSGMQNREENH